MIVAYSEKHKPLEEKAIDKLVGCEALLIGKDKYYKKGDCTSDFLKTIHEKEMPYVLAKSIEKNEFIITGAVAPRYTVFNGDATLSVLDKEIIPMTNFTERNGVNYSSISWEVKKFPATKVYDFPVEDFTNEILSMGTEEYQCPYCRWDKQRCVWVYNSTSQERVFFDYPMLKLARDGYLIPREPIEFNGLGLEKGKTNDVAFVEALDWAFEEQEQIKNVVRLNQIHDYNEREEYRGQLSAVDLVMNTATQLELDGYLVTESNILKALEGVHMRKYKNGYQTYTDIKTYIELYAHMFAEFF